MITRAMLSLCFVLFALAPAQAQTDAAVATVSVPHVVQYAGTVTNSTGGPVSVKFALYAAQTGGEPVWSETQQVAPDAKGRYSVLLGSATEGGLPQPVFSSAEAKWLGVAVGDGAEGPRVVLVATPYSLKASDAETLAGHPVSDFKLATNPSGKPDAAVDITAVDAGTGIDVTGNGTPTVTVSLDPTYLGNLAANYALLKASNTFTGNQTINGNAAINGTLTVSGTIFSPFLDSIAANLPTLTGTNAFSGANTFSKPIVSSVATGTAPFSVASSTVVPNLNAALLGGKSASAFAAVAANNLFANTQTLTSNGAATTGAGTNSFPLELQASSYNSNASAAEAINFFLMAEPANNNTASPSGTLDLLYSTGTNAAAETGLMIASTGAITFAGGQTFPGVVTPSSNNAFTGTNSFSKPITFAGSQTFPGAATVSGNNTFTGTNSFSSPITFAGSQTFPGTITSVSAGSPLTASTTSGAVTLGLNATTLESTLDGLYAQLGASLNTFTGGASFGSTIEANRAAGASTAAILGFGTNGVTGTYGATDTGYGVWGFASGTGGYGVYGSGTDTGAIGVYGSGTTGVYGTSSAADENALEAIETGTGGHGLYAHASGGASSPNTPIGVFGLADNGIGTLGTAVSASSIYSSYLMAGYTSGAWGDTSASGSTLVLAGITGSAIDNDAAYFINDSSDSTTVYASNESSGGTGTVVPVITAMGAKGVCGMNGSGDVTCSGRLKTAVPMAGSDEKVEVYSVQSSENWFEDFGSAKLENGHVTVAIDPRFAGIVNTGVEYHVFLTPNGNCKGLYVAGKSANGFEVRELGDGGSTVAFDYRIVAKRAGHESERLGDATAEMHTMTARHDMVKARLAAAPPVKQPVAGPGLILPTPAPPRMQPRSTHPAVIKAQPAGKVALPPTAQNLVPNAHQ